MSVNRNLAASFAGNAWAALVQVAFVPVYIHLLGVEAFGLIGFYAVVQASLWILDMGFTPAVSREVARALAGEKSVDEARALLRSIEWVFVAGAVLLVGLAFFAAPWVADRWLDVQVVSRDSAVNAVRLMAALIALRLFVGVHRGVITGAQEIAWLSGIAAAAATLRGAGVIPVLWLHPSIEVFFGFQLAATALEAGALGLKAWRLLPSADSPRPSVAMLRSVRGFSGAMVVVALLYVVLTQGDKVLLSALRPLGDFAQYALAASVAGMLNLLVAPVATVAYPRLNHVHARGGSLAEEVHGFAAIVTLAAAPAAAVLVFFAQPLLEAWTRDPTISAAAAPLLSCLAFGSLLHAFTAVPYLLPLVRGRPRSVAAAYGSLVAVALPVLAVAISARGALGAALAWVVLCLPGFALCWPLMRGALTPRQRGRWLGRDVLAPTAAALSVVAVMRVLTSNAGPTAGVAAAALAYALALAVAALCLPEARRFIAGNLRLGSGAAVEVQEEQEVG